MMEIGSGRFKKLALITLIGAAAILAATSLLPSSSFLMQKQPNESKNIRQLSIALPDGGCRATPAVLADPPLPHPASFVASYPGSGARMTWNLIEALTGLVTGDDWDTNGHGKNVVTVKTHYPQKNGRVVPFAEEIPRVILVIRNIKDAMPSLHNFRYEFQHKLDNHSTRAPVDEWITWRNRNFEEEIQSWMKHVRYWVEQYDSANRLVLAYEDMVGDTKGPIAAMKISSFLAQADGVEPIDRASVPCIWNVVVKRKGEKKGVMQLKDSHKFVGNNPNEPNSLRKGGEKVKPYNKFQIEQMMGVLGQLKEDMEKKTNEEELIRILKMYLASVDQLEYHH